MLAGTSNEQKAPHLRGEQGRMELRNGGNEITRPRSVTLFYIDMVFLGLLRL